MPKDCIVEVITRNLKTNEKDIRTINYNSKDDRTWLAKHSAWALRHNRSVTSCPVDLVEG